MFAHMSHVPSFFDDYSSKNRFRFSKPKPKHQKDIDTLPLCTSTLICQDSTINQTSEGLFSLHNNLLVLYMVVIIYSYTSSHYLSLGQLNEIGIQGAWPEIHEAGAGGIWSQEDAVWVQDYIEWKLVRVLQFGKGDNRTLDFGAKICMYSDRFSWELSSN